MSENVIDLNDLVQSVNFTVLDNSYEIPPMNDVKMKKVMALSKKISALSDTDEGKSMTDEQESELLDSQNTILVECVSIRKGEKGEELKQLKKGDFADWPMKLKSKVLELVFGQLGSDVTPDGEAEKN